MLIVVVNLVVYVVLVVVVVLLVVVVLVVVVGVMCDAYLVDLLALKEVEQDRLTNRRTYAFLALLSLLKIHKF